MRIPESAARVVKAEAAVDAIVAAIDGALPHPDELTIDWPRVAAAIGRPVASDATRDAVRRAYRVRWRLTQPPDGDPFEGLS